MKTCTCCKEIKPLDQFYKVKVNKDGYCGYCIQCDKAKKAEYYQGHRDEALGRARNWSQTNPDKSREYKRNWKRKNPSKSKQYKHRRRALESVEHFTADEWEALLLYYGSKCLNCGSLEKVTADHVVPLALGGSNGIDNIQPLCMDCNCKKGIQALDYREL